MKDSSSIFGHWLFEKILRIRKRLETDEIRNKTKFVKGTPNDDIFCIDEGSIESLGRLKCLFWYYIISCIKFLWHFCDDILMMMNDIDISFLESSGDWQEIDMFYVLRYSIVYTQGTVQLERQLEKHLEKNANAPTKYIIWIFNSFEIWMNPV